MSIPQSLLPALESETVRKNLKVYAKNGSVEVDITLLVNQVLVLNVIMQPGGAQETVEVTSQTPLIDTTSTQLGAVVETVSIVAPLPVTVAGLKLHELSDGRPEQDAPEKLMTPL